MFSYTLFEKNMRNLRTGEEQEESGIARDSSFAILTLSRLQELATRTPTYEVSYRGDIREWERESELYAEDVVLVTEKQNGVVRTSVHPFMDQVARNALNTSYVFLREGEVVSCFGTNVFCERKNNALENLVVFSGDEVSSALLLLEGKMIEGEVGEPRLLYAFNSEDEGKARFCIPVTLRAGAEFLGNMVNAKAVLFPGVPNEEEVKNMSLSISLCIDRETGVILEKSIKTFGDRQERMLTETSMKFASFSQSSSGLYYPFIPKEVLKILQER